MRMLLLFLTFFHVPHTPLNDPDLKTVRSLYYQAAIDKASSEKLGELLEGVDSTSAPLMICYKGAAEMLKAKYAASPLTKIKRFKTGKQLIEQAAKKDSANLEIRFVRFAIQTNLPGFLNYKDSIPADKDFLLNHTKETTDGDLKNNIIAYLSSSKYCTAEEIKQLKSDG